MAVPAAPVPAALSFHCLPASIICVWALICSLRTLRAVYGGYAHYRDMINIDIIHSVLVAAFTST